MADLPRRLAAEFLGTALLVAAVVGSGIMAERLTGDIALALLCNALATGAALTVLITVLAPVSGAHLNPAVSLVLAMRGDIPALDAASCSVAQIVGGLAGTLLAHAMFAMPLVEISQHVRTGQGQWLSEGVATFGLVLLILGCARDKTTSIAALVGLYIGSAYWFTASTSFANPAVTIARSLTDTFSGIRWIDVAPFVAAQLAGAVIALVVARWLFVPSRV